MSLGSLTGLGEATSCCPDDQSNQRCHYSRRESCLRPLVSTFRINEASSEKGALLSSTDDSTSSQLASSQEQVSMREFLGCLLEWTVQSEQLVE
jgi:hypothetical protein